MTNYTTIQEKVLGSVNRRYVDNELVEYSVSYFSNFPISSIVYKLKEINGIDTVIDYETSYHIEVSIDLNQCSNKIKTLIDNTFLSTYNIQPLYV